MTTTNLADYYREKRFIPTTFDILTADKLDLHRRKRENLYVNKLAVPAGLWRNARVLEVGCASGENSLLYAEMGARLTLVEPVSFSIDQLKRLFGHYRLESSIEAIRIGRIEEADLGDGYDLVVAEGFLNTLEQRTAVLRKLFGAVKPHGLLIISANDRAGCFLETVKAAIAQLYCRRRGIQAHDDQVEAVRPFFQDDYDGIPHSRDFSLWAKDVLLNPIMTSNPYWDFDEIAAGLAGLDPHFYSSWPDYRPYNDLTWHKHLPNPGSELDTIIQSYRNRRPSYLLGQVLDESQALRFAVENRDGAAVGLACDLIEAIHQDLHHDGNGRVFETVRRGRRQCRGLLLGLMTEVETNLTALDPAVYRNSPILRGHWGVPCHYTVWRKAGGPA